MISRHITCKAKNDNYRRLALYIADAHHKGEKTLDSWCAGCWSGDDDYEMAITETEIVQSLNVRSSKEKTYHLMISFRPEDEAKLTPEILREIEIEFAKSLGLEEHQRHAGVHKNTNNLHLHVAYNLIHPERRTRHEPYRDFWIRDKLCRTLEQKYGLSPDNGRDPERNKSGTNEQAATYESHTGEESLFSYVGRHKIDILADVNEAKTWTDCHTTLFKYGLLLKPHGNGLVIQSLTGKHSIKASSLDRSFSKNKLALRFGPYVSLESNAIKNEQPVYTYTSAPLHTNVDTSNPSRDKLYEQYKIDIEQRRHELDTLNKQQKQQYQDHCKQWEKVRQDIAKTPMTRQHRREVLSTLKKKQSDNLTSMRKQTKEQQTKVRIRYPYHNWNGYLQHLAKIGHETALAILRSRDKKGASTTRPKEITEALGQMKQLLGASASHMDYQVDARGTLVFTLPGGTIRDTGREVYHSGNGSKLAEIAAKYSGERFKKTVSNSQDIPFNLPPPEQGMSR